MVHRRGGALVLSRLLGPWFTFAAWEASLRELAAGGDGALRFAADHLLGRLAPFSLVASLGAPSHATAAVSLSPSIVAGVLLGAIALKLVVEQLADASGDADPPGENILWLGILLQFFVLVALAAVGG